MELYNLDFNLVDESLVINLSCPLPKEFKYFGEVWEEVINHEDFQRGIITTKRIE